jgi:hypothetical protein
MSDPTSRQKLTNAFNEKGKKLVIGFLDLSGYLPLIPSSFGAFDVVIEAFWVNYPFCYSKQTCINNCDPSTDCTPNISCAVAAGIKRLKYELKDGKPNNTCVGTEPLTADSTWAKENNSVTFPKKRPQMLKYSTGNVVPMMRNEKSASFNESIIKENPLASSTFDINKILDYLNTFHTSDYTVSKTFIETTTGVKLAGIGGWYMGGSAEAKPSEDAFANNWAVCLKNTGTFVDTIVGIVGLGYDGFDIDCETLYAGDLTGLKGINCTTVGDKNCYASDFKVSETVEKFTDLFTSLLNDTRLVDKVFSITPRAKDVFTVDGQGKLVNGFFASIFDNMVSSTSPLNRTFDILTIQFYNDDDDYCLTSPSNDGGGLGKYVIPIIDEARHRWSTIFTYFQLGMTGKVSTSNCDATDMKYCITSDQINTLWTKQLSSHFTGITLWGINKLSNGSDDFVQAESSGETAEPNTSKFTGTPIHDTNWLNVKDKQYQCEGSDCKFVQSCSGSGTCYTNDNACGGTCKTPDTPVQPDKPVRPAVPTSCNLHYNKAILIAMVVLLSVAVIGISISFKWGKNIGTGVFSAVWLSGMILLVIFLLRKDKCY